MNYSRLNASMQLDKTSSIRVLYTKLLNKRILYVTTFERIPVHINTYKDINIITQQHKAQLKCTSL
jgi:hypothetical protein